MAAYLHVDMESLLRGSGIDQMVWRCKSLPAGVTLLLGKLRVLLTKPLKIDGTASRIPGAIFTMPLGNAEPFKKELLAHRAQTTVPLKQDSTESNHISEAKESQQ